MLVPSIFGENLFDDWMDFSFPHFDKALYRKSSQDAMKTDVKETPEGYEMDIDLPGYQKEEVQAKLENGYLTIQASKSENQDEKDSEGKYIRRERYVGSVSRSFYLGEGVQKENIKAKFENGILKLTIPKNDPEMIQASKCIAIEG
ncbi:MAG: Hsp20/alpha crystallin family protein [Eubacteriales bacterium]|nr:Hsp20/alpha crystallin family protein [Eubacteriales bacterium]